MRWLTRGFLLSCIFLSSLSAQDLGDMKEDFNRKITTIKSTYDTKGKKLLITYISKLDFLEKRAKDAGDLDALLAVRDEVKRIEFLDPDRMETVRNVGEGDLGKLQSAANKILSGQKKEEAAATKKAKEAYLGDLKQLQIDLTRDDKIAEAILVKDEIAAVTAPPEPSLDDFSFDESPRNVAAARPSSSLPASASSPFGGQSQTSTSRTTPAPSKLPKVDEDGFWINGNTPENVYRSVTYSRENPPPKFSQSVLKKMYPLTGKTLASYGIQVQMQELSYSGTVKLTRYEKGRRIQYEALRQYTWPRIYLRPTKPTNDSVQIVVKKETGSRVIPETINLSSLAQPVMIDARASSTPYQHYIIKVVSKGVTLYEGTTRSNTDVSEMRSRGGEVSQTPSTSSTPGGSSTTSRYNADYSGMKTGRVYNGSGGSYTNPYSGRTRVNGQAKPAANGFSAGRNQSRFGK